MEKFMFRGQKKLRCGYTTGSCAAAAAKASALMLLSGFSADLTEITLLTPKGILLTLPLLDVVREDSYVSCAVRKDSGDDPDQTDGVLIYAKVSKRDDSLIIIEGGNGVGRVTKPGLSCKVGEAAINPGPRAQIEAQLRQVAQEYGYQGGFSVLISVPGGEELAKKTFNPRLGIVGGISILGTSGIVEPMSESALKDSIRLELHMLRESGQKSVILVPGNYGEQFVRQTMGIKNAPIVLCSNFVGDSIDDAVTEGFERLLLVGHIGKFIKLSGGIMNTHSSMADCRMELLGIHALLAGASTEQVATLMFCMTTEDAISKLKEWDLLDKTMCSVMKKTEESISSRADGVLSGVVMFSNRFGVLGQTSHANRILQQIKETER